MKATLLIIVFITSGFCSFSQNNEELILGEWTFSELKHFDSDSIFNRESTDHYSNMLYGRTLLFASDGSVVIPAYDNCSWYIKDGHLFMQYSATGKWSKSEILQLDDEILKLGADVDFPEEGNSSITTYEATSE